VIHPPAAAGKRGRDPRRHQVEERRLGRLAHEQELDPQERVDHGAGHLPLGRLPEQPKVPDRGALLVEQRPDQRHEQEVVPGEMATPVRSPGGPDHTQLLPVADDPGGNADGSARFRDLPVGGERGRLGIPTAPLCRCITDACHMMA